MPLTTGQSLSFYEILGPVGAGGMGEVYRARDTRLDREIAIKILPPELTRHEEAKQRFLVEARAASGFEHPNICTVHAVEETEEGDLFLAMALYEGETLRERLDRGAMPIDEALRAAAEVADGLAAAHAQGILHRDIKPANIAFASDGRAVILDFGLAKVTDLDLTAPGTTLGTLAYMSPEQARGQVADARADVWSLGVVLYEMLRGEQPFQGEGAAVLRSVLDDEPPPLAGNVEGLDPAVEDIVRRCLAKDPDRRMPGAARLLAELRDATAPVVGPRNRRPMYVVMAAAAAIVLAVSGWFFTVLAAERRVQSEVLPELDRLVLQARYDMSAAPGWQAVDLLQQAQDVLGEDPRLDALWPKVTTKLNLTSEPPGALVRVRPYGIADAPWRELGRTPMESAVVAIGMSEVELELEGHRTTEDILWGMSYYGEDRRYLLSREGQAPDEMVRVAYENHPVQLPGLDHLDAEPMVDFLCDRHEVTNADYKRFVDAGAYKQSEFWQVPFVSEGQRLTFEQAMQRFVDRTGLPGPSTWEGGDYPDGEAQHPVGGLSWYEAEAYARFVDKELPTVFHWATVAFPYASSEIIPRSNYGKRMVPVDATGGHNRYGARDLAGNAREWCANAVADSESRFILGGGFDDQPYSFNDAYAADAFDRSPTNGFRCIRIVEDEPNRVELGRSIETPFRDFSSEAPVDDETFGVYLRQFDYDRMPLNATVDDERVEEHGTRQVVSFDAAYGGERVQAVVMLPKASKPPYQTVVLFWGSNAIHSSTSERIGTDAFKPILASGRAVVLPIYKGTFERGTELKSDYPDETHSYKDHVVWWGKDLRRSVDYLEEREDIDADRLAYFGLSWGGALGGIMPAVETRLRCSVLLVAGMLFQRSLPEVDQLNYLPRVKQPTLMLNGEYDFFFPVDTAQKPMFELLGTPAEHKRYEVYPGAHTVPRTVSRAKMLAWFDKYLGKVE